MHINIHSLNLIWRQATRLWCWFVSVTDTEKGGLSNTHQSTYNTNGSAKQSRLPLICRDGPAAVGLKQIGRTTEKLVLLLLILYGPRTSGQGSPLTRHSFTCIIDTRVKDKNIKNHSPFLLFSCI